MAAFAKHRRLEAISGKVRGASINSSRAPVYLKQLWTISCVFSSILKIASHRSSLNKRYENEILICRYSMRKLTLAFYYYFLIICLPWKQRMWILKTIQCAPQSLNCYKKALTDKKILTNFLIRGFSRVINIESSPLPGISGGSQTWHRNCPSFVSYQLSYQNLALPISVNVSNNIPRT